MTYIVNDKCIKCKFMDCVEVCPVDCFYEGENMLVIHPDECIDCGVCEPLEPAGGGQVQRPPAPPALRAAGSGRPTKHERRAIERFTGEDDE